MAELMIKVGPNGLWQDGDIISAYSRRRIEISHLQTICFPRLATGKRPLLPTGHSFDGRGLTGALLERSWRYKFERVSYREVLRTDGETGEQQIFSNRPSEKDEAIDVPAYLARRLWYNRQPWVKGGGKPILGIPGREVWYDTEMGRLTAEGINELWALVEARTSYRRALCQRIPRGRKNHHLMLPVDDITESQVVEYEQQWKERETTVLQRVCYVPYWEVLSAAERRQLWSPTRDHHIMSWVRSRMIIERKISKNALRTAA